MASPGLSCTPNHLTNNQELARVGRSGNIRPADSWILWTEIPRSVGSSEGINPLEGVLQIG
jgi:hypothetical protein